MTNNYLKQDMTVYELAQFMIKHCASKNDLKGFATKDDLAKCATKDDLKQFATKEDLKNFATKDDLTKMETRLADKIDRNYIHVNRRIDVLAEKIA